MGAAEGRHSPRRIRKSARLLSVAPTLTANVENHRTEASFAGRRSGALES